MAGTADGAPGVTGAAAAQAGHGRSGPGPCPSLTVYRDGQLPELVASGMLRLHHIWAEKF